MAQSSHYSGNNTSTTSQELRDKATQQYDKMADNVEGAMKSVAERGREVGEDVQAVAGNIKSAVDTSVKEQPMATLAVVAALGFVMGALWKS
jgi:ElaB/YqjD/DUF883 family membrane-anchored ribosome-binding protein